MCIYSLLFIIYVSPVVLISTLVHELIHYHMFVVGKFRPNPPEVEEGVCELAAALILKSTLNDFFPIVHTRVLTFQKFCQLLYLRSLPQGDDRDMRIRQVLIISKSQLLPPNFFLFCSTRPSPRRLLEEFTEPRACMLNSAWRVLHQSTAVGSAWQSRSGGSSGATARRSSAY
jgi:hypothetical protein